MNKQTILSLFLLIVFSTLLVGCGEAKEVTEEDNSTGYGEMTTVVLTDSYTTIKPKQQEVVVTKQTEQEVFLRSGSDAIIEFANTENEAMRLIVYGTNVDAWLRPNERLEVRFNTAPQVIYYLFGDEYKQIIVS